MANLPVALQMYTLRDDAGKDFEGTFAKVAEIGYAGVEFAGYGGMNASQIKAMLDRLGLKVAGSHTGIDQLESGIDAVIDFHKEIGNEFVVIPFLGDEYRQGAEGWKKTANAMTQYGQKLAEAGLQLCYHNHSFEFQKFDGVYGLDLLYQTADASAVKAEIDTYWVKHGGEEPIDYIRKYSGRVPLIHLKDMAAGEGREFAEVGEGILDIRGIVEASKQAGSKWIIVEQDTCKQEPLASVKLSLDNLKKMGLAQ